MIKLDANTQKVLSFNPLKSGQLFQIKMNTFDYSRVIQFQSPKIGSVVSNSKASEYIAGLRLIGRFNPLKSGQLFQISSFSFLLY